MGDPDEAIEEMSGRLALVRERLRAAGLTGKVVMRLGGDGPDALVLLACEAVVRGPSRVVAEVEWNPFWAHFQVCGTFFGRGLDYGGERGLPWRTPDLDSVVTLVRQSVKRRSLAPREVGEVVRLSRVRARLEAAGVESFLGVGVGLELTAMASDWRRVFTVSSESAGGYLLLWTWVRDGMKIWCRHEVRSPAGVVELVCSPDLSGVDR
ncbi:hypothetical protein [Acrocarpospora catenulata]|uniref:hypothetical protein n=1 Tax=Acrocarpospora catenulata TaxID=2836182 RepID=UPI001BDA2408|nr:hypothetical protein [Acrocarpospora catenulata]